MFINSSFIKTQHLLNRAMSAESLRHTVITDNIANVDTPNFKRSEVVFEAELERALKSESPYPFKAKLTNDRHIPFYQPKDYRTVTPKVSLEYNTSYRNDKNNVDIDKEMVGAAVSTMRFNSFSSITGRYFRKMNILLRG